MMSLPPSSSESSQGFDRLAEPVQRWIWHQGWETLHEIQERSISAILDHERDVIIAAATAQGKTEAAFLPLVSSVLHASEKTGFDLVYLSPLKALINDQFERLQDLGERADLPVYPWHGDISLNIKQRARRKPRGILMITPESLEAFFILRGHEVPRVFQGVQAVVIDELHAFLGNERGIHVRSLLTRMEQSTGRRIRRVGLSATLRDMHLVREYLRPEDPKDVDVLEDKASQFWLKAQIRGYLKKGQVSDEKDPDDHDRQTHEVVKHLSKTLRGKRNLIFAGSRQNVEFYADALRQYSQKNRWPLEFFPHHASLSKDHRMGLEERLKSHPATTAVCTTTLELGIDIGEIESVAQIGPAFSVSSLRQRLGRSGRRKDVPAVLRIYQIETDPGSDSHLLDRLFLGLIQSIAMMELLRQKWCEPPSPQALHLSTLTHQILSVIAEHGGTSASHLYETLCLRGPFLRVTRSLFARLLRQIGSPDVALIEQGADGTLLLGKAGERITEHYSFYAVFQTPEEYRIIADHQQLGTLPISMVLTQDMTIVFSGRRWRILRIHDREKIIEVTSDRVGKPLSFGGEGGLLHDRVVAEMRNVLKGTEVPVYLDAMATELLEDARVTFQRLNLDETYVVKIGERHALIATWVGTIKSSTLALVLSGMGYSVDCYDGFLDVTWTSELPPVMIALSQIAHSDASICQQSISPKATLQTEKFHRFLSTDLLMEDAASSRLDFEAMPTLARTLISSIQ